MVFQVQALNEDSFRDYFGKSDSELHAMGAKAFVATDKPGFPCRLSLEDAEPGTRLILLNYEHLPVNSPYRSSHAIFIIDGGTERRVPVDHVPDYIKSRMVSVRSYDADGMMVNGVAVQGDDAAEVFRQMLADGDVAYLHVHTASRGCYLAAVTRAE